MHVQIILVSSIFVKMDEVPPLDPEIMLFEKVKWAQKCLLKSCEEIILLTIYLFSVFFFLRVCTQN